MIEFLKSLFRSPSPTKEATPEQIETIKGKVKDVLVEVRGKYLDDEIFKDREVPLARKKINKALTKEEKQIAGTIEVGYSVVHDDLAAKFRGEFVISYDPERGLGKEELQSIIQEENSL